MYIMSFVNWLMEFGVTLSYNIVFDQRGSMKGSYSYLSNYYLLD